MLNKTDGVIGPFNAKTGSVLKGLKSKCRACKNMLSAKSSSIAI